jgi:hypothetical protein
VRYLLLVALVACASKHPVVTWVSSGTSASERIEIPSSGYGRYTSASNGVAEKDESVILSNDQLNELAELFRTQRVCELADDPAYKPAPGEGRTTLELAFPDQHCKVSLWDFAWQHGRAKDITETMHSMRPLRQPRPARSH